MKPCLLTHLLRSFASALQATPTEFKFGKPVRAPSSHVHVVPQKRIFRDFLMNQLGPLQLRSCFRFTSDADFTRLQHTQVRKDYERGYTPNRLIYFGVWTMQRLDEQLKKRFASILSGGTRLIQSGHEVLYNETDLLFLESQIFCHHPAKPLVGRFPERTPPHGPFHCLRT